MTDDPWDDNRNGNVVSFRSRGGAPPGLPPIPGAPPPAPPDPPAPASGPEGGDGGLAVPFPRRRRSAADSLADLAPTLPSVPGSTGSTGTVVLRSEGTAPARRDGDDEEADGPGVAALGLAATLAIALAALRGTATVLTDWRQRRMERAEELAPLREARLKHWLAGEEAAAKHAVAMQGIGDKAAQKRGKAIPSSNEYGRKALGGGGGGRGSLTGGGGKGAGGTGPGRIGKSGSGASGTAPGSKKISPKTTTGSGLAGGKNTGSKSSGPGKNGSSGKNGGSGSGIKSPSGGKSPSSKKSSPALERARGRQDRAAARQGAAVQRRADRQTARLENRAKDARQDTKDRVRNARVDAKEARKAQVRQDRFEGKQKARKDRAEARRKKKETAAAADADRTTLGQSVAKSAERRLKKRRKNLSPPVLTTVKRKKSKKKGGKKKGSAPAGPKVDLTKKPKPGAAPKVDLTKKPKAASGSATGVAPKTDLTMKPKPGGTKGSGPSSKRARVKSKKKSRGSTAGTGPADRRKASRKERARRARERARARTGADSSAGTGWEFYTPPPREERRSAYDSMHNTDPQQLEVWTAEPVFPAGYQAPGRESLTTGARGLPAGTGSSSTTNTKEAPVGNSPAVKTGAVTTAMDDGMDPEHATEVTLDDVTEFLDEVVLLAFAAHDECLLLSAQAKELMYALDLLATRLAAKHNIIGRITSWAMSKLAESMEVLSRKAEEMSVKSLHAAETCETAKTEMEDAYRPLSQATADAGVRTPSARVHNEN